ncbi:hypothetical protein V502_05739 [Pseudogymnoascus sp. VKM F-4520 (FW-2644)]|nr:hypothetical protein V502_05739 [Pseudogymnoascus sp. VKM F-4520 (FW-2644)]
MFSRALRRAVQEVRVPSSTLPPTFLLPSQARYFNSTEQHVEPPTSNSGASQAPLASHSPIATEAIASAAAINAAQPTAPSTPYAITESVKELLPLLNAQPSKFITALIHGRPYLLTVGDTVRLPFHMPGVVPGDVLRLNRASAIGSRDYTLKGQPHVDERVFECRAVVMGTEGEPARIKIKKKQRNRRTKTVISKHKFTVLRLSELRVKELGEIEQ